jgi:serine protease Do
VGDWVVAIGSPFGLGATVTAGIVSARARDINSGPYDDFIQTDAAINRGNSGGPLLDLQGNIVGVNTAILSPGGGNIGIGFAVPTSLAKPVIRELREKGEVERGWLGVRIQTVSRDIADAVGLDEPRGALVAEVTGGGPAEAAGVRVGDVIVGFAGEAIAEMRDLPIAVARAPVGETAQLKVWRDGKTVTLIPEIARLETPDPQPRRSGSAPGEKTPSLGLTLSPLTPDLRRQFELDTGQSGAVVTNVDPNGPAASHGFRPGDVITRAGTTVVDSPQDVERAVEVARDADRQSLLVLRRRGDAQAFVALPLQREG